MIKKNKFDKINTKNCISFSILIKEFSMSKSKNNNVSLVNLLIVLCGVATFVFFFLPMIYFGFGNATVDSVWNTIGGKTESTFFDLFQKDAIDVIFAIIGVAIIAWDLIDTGLAFCFPLWGKFGKLRAFIQLITALAWIGIMVYYLITVITTDGLGIAYALIVLLVLAVVSALFKAYSAKQLVSKK